MAENSRNQDCHLGNSGIDNQEEIPKLVSNYLHFIPKPAIKVMVSIILSLKSYISTLTSYKQVLGSETRILGKREQGLRRCNYICLIFCIIALSLDPLFCYILVVNEENKCLTLDTTLGNIAIVLRSAIDFFYILLVIFQIPSFQAPEKDPKKKTYSKKFYLYLIVDVLVILPLPQVVIFAIIPKLNDSRVFNATSSLNFIVIFQYVLRVLRICSLLKKVTRASEILAETAWANLSLFILASHVVGAFWYLFSVERKASCWREACQNQGGHGVYCSLYCGDTAPRVSYTYLNDSCSTKSPNSSAVFNFGIYLDALEFGVVDSAHFVHKISYCFWWGLQSLSSVGQNLKTSTYIWEIYFSVAISISGLLLYALLIGNIQEYLHAKSAKSAEMKSKGHEIELWMAFHSLPPDLQRRFRQHHKYEWEETRGVKLEKILRSLPRDLMRDTMEHLCSAPLNRVPILKDITDKRLLNAICDHLKPVQYIKDSVIFREGEPLDEMLFITRGYLRTSTTSSDIGRNTETDKKFLGRVYGEELFNWALNFPKLSNPPLSSRTVEACEDLEVFVLRANELKNVITKFWWLFTKQQQRPGFPLINLEEWKHKAAYALQAAWRRHYKRIKDRKSTKIHVDSQNDSLALTILDPACPAAVSSLSSSSSDRISTVAAPPNPSSKVAPLGSEAF